MKLPDKDEWEEAWTGLDEACAFKNFFGKTLQEALELFQTHALYYQEDLVYMPEKPFRYYFRAYTHYLWSDKSRGDSDGASCYLSLIRIRLDDHPDWLDSTWPDVERVLQKLATNQEFYDASPGIYGSFSKKVDRVLAKRTKAQQGESLKP